MLNIIININGINMDNKVSEKWFEERGWIRTDVPYENTIDGQGRTTEVKQTIFVLSKGKHGEPGYRHARWDHHTSVSRDRRGKICNTSNWYSFFVSGKGFHIESRISYRRFSIEQVESALKIVGLE